MRKGTRVKLTQDITESWLHGGSSQRVLYPKGTTGIIKRTHTIKYTGDKVWLVELGEGPDHSWWFQDFLEVIT